MQLLFHADVATGQKYLETTFVRTKVSVRPYVEAHPRGKKTPGWQTSLG
jgi:hypothetical protein